MVLVPDLSGLSSSAAQSAITAAGLTVGSISSTSSGANSGNNGQVASSSPTTGTLVDYETSVSFVTYSYSPPPVVNPPVWIDSAISNYFQVNESYSDSVSASNGASYTWEYVDSENGASPAQFWPAGVSISNGSGVISGSPTTSGQAYSFRIAAYNTGGTIYSQTYSGNVNSSSTPSLTLSVDFNTPSSSTSLSGAIIADNTTTGASYSVTVSTNAGSISPTSFVVNGYSQVVQPFTVTGLSLGQTATVTASSTGVTASNSATTTSTGPTYRFESSTSGYPSPQSGESVSSEGSFVAQGAQIGTTVYVNAGNCGSNGIYIYAPQQWWWRCFVTN
jgi:hypothetical protein